MNEAAVASPRLAALAAAAGCAALVARPPLLRAAPDPAGALAVLFAMLLAVGACWPPARAVVASRTTRDAIGALAVGAAAFALARVLGGGQAPAPLTARVVVLGTLAAVAEEAFFRRLVYGALLSGGAAWAVGGSAVLFALVHVTVYGAWVLPIDLAAGVLLSWQRWISGSWAVPAATHVLANLLMVI